ncbi:phosphotransferase [Myxococcota bacterium]|nr:phosphotransferase [Myxococcota bacterium]
MLAPVEEIAVPAPPGARPSLAAFADVLTGPLSEALGRPLGPEDVSLLRPAPTGVADATAQLLVRGRDGAPLAVVLTSSLVAPGLVAQAMVRARDAKLALGPELGRPILDPLREGTVLGVSYAVLPYCRPLPSGWVAQRVATRVLAPSVLTWLRAVTQATLARPSHEDLQTDFAAHLERVAALEPMSRAARRLAWDALGRLETGEWSPRTVLMHQDLWIGNVLVDDRPDALRAAPSWGERFVVIDWPGALLEGYPFFDLVRFAGSIKLGGRALRRELELHAEILGCSPLDAVGGVLAAVGHMASLGDHFPRAALVQMTEQCVAGLARAGVVRLKEPLR